VDRRPSVSHRYGELEAVHGSRHLDIGEHDSDVQSGFEYRDRFICVRRFHDLKSGFFDHLRGIHSNEELILDNEHHGSLGRRALHFVGPSRNLTQRRLNVIVP
jgi:hypothetical protein